MNCPICKAEYRSELLLEGRCPRCGGVVEWTSGDTDDFDASKIQPHVTVSLSPRPIARDRDASRKTHSAKKQKTVEIKKSPVDDKSLVDDKSKVDQKKKTVNVKEKTVEIKKNGSGTVIGVDQNASIADHDDPAMQPPKSGTVVDHPGDSQGQPGGSGTDSIGNVRKAWQTAASGIYNTYSTIRTDFGSSGDTIQVVINERNMQGDRLKSLSSDYDLLDQIGQGAVGVVYAAQQNSIDREVAVKMLHDNNATSDESKEKFLFEAVVTGDLDHPNIVPIHELGKNQQGDLFYSMKKIEGNQWSESIGEKTLAENLEVLLKVCDAVAFAHSRGIIHRDLKPENIMLGEYGEVLVVDWGIALPVSGYTKSQVLQFKPSISGTPAYMAPEMATGPIEKIGIPSDVYLLGAMLFEMITGKPPHAGKDALDCVMSAAKNQIVSFESDQEPMSIALRCLSTDPDDRYDSVFAFKEALSEYKSHIESITLADRAEEAFEQALDSRDYQDFSRALFAFEEALELWSENKKAQEGIRSTNLEYARCALEKSDFDLGLSRVDADDREFRSLARQLKKGAEARDRRQSMVSLLRNLAIVLVLTIIIGGTYAYFRQRSLLQQTDEARETATEKQGIAENALKDTKKALNEKNEAIQGKEAALVMQAEALKKEEVAKKDAEKARERTLEMLEALEEATYVTRLGATEEKIDQNAFTTARDFVSGLVSSNQGLLHWEWGRLNYLCNEMSDLVQLELDRPLDLVEVVRAGQIPGKGFVLAIAEASGQFHLKFNDGSAAHFSLALNGEAAPSIYGLKFSPNGRWLAVAGAVEREGGDTETGPIGVVRLWDTQNLQKEPIALSEHGNRVTAIAFSPDSKNLLSAADDNSIRRYELTNYQLVSTYTGHMSVIWDCEFDTSGSRFVTASDKDVRIWALDQLRPIRRFSEHRCAVFAACFVGRDQQILSADSMGRIFRWTIAKSSFTDFDNSDSESSLIQKTRERVKSLSDDKTKIDTKKLVRTTSDTVVLKAHSKAIRQLDISANREFYISASDDNLVKVWKLADSSQSVSPSPEIHSLRAHGGSVRSAVFGPQSQFVYSGGFDRQVRRWNLKEFDDSGIHYVEQVGSRSVNIALSPDRKWAAFGRTDGSTRLQSLENDKESDLLTSGHSYLSTSSVLTPDRSLLISAAGDDTVRIWDFRLGTEKSVIENTGRRGLLAISQSGEFFTTGKGESNIVQLFKTNTQELVGEYSIGKEKDVDGKRIDLTSIDLSSNGRFILAGDSFGDCYLWDIESGSLVGNWRSQFAGIVKVAFYSNQDESIQQLKFITAGREGVVSSWTIGSADAEGAFTLESGDKLVRRTLITRTNEILSDVVINRSLNRVATVKVLEKKNNELDSVTVNLVSLESDETPVVTTFDKSRIHAICFAEPDSSKLLIAATAEGEASKLYSWNGTLESKPSPFAEGRDFSSVRSLLLVDDSDQLLTVGGKGIQRWDLGTGDLVIDFRSHSQANACAFSPDGNLLVTGGAEGAATIWQVDTQKQVAKIQHPELRAVTATRFLRADKLLVSDRKGHVFECKMQPDGAVSCKLLIQHPGSAVQAFEVNNDHSLLFTAGEDGKVIIWDLDSKQPVKTLDHRASVSCLAVSPDGRFLATGTAENSAFLWNIGSGVRMGTISGHSGVVASLEFSKDSLRLLSAGQDGNAILWDLTPTLRMDTRIDSEDSDQVTINEVFALSNLADTLIGAFFVNNSKDILAVSPKGHSLIRGSRVSPAIRLSRGLVEVENGTTAAIDPLMIFSLPTSRSREQTLTLEFTIRDLNGNPVPVKDCFRLATPKDGLVQLRVKDGRIEWAVTDSSWLEIGQFTSQEGTAKIRIVPDSNYLFAVNQILRSVILETEQIEQEKLELELQLQSESGSGEPIAIQTEKMVVSISRNVNVGDVAVLGLESTISGGRIEGK